MTESPPIREPASSDSQEADLARYHSYSGMAVAGLFLGMLSVVAFWHPILCCVPAAAALVNIFALRRIAHFAPELAGRGMALAGLGMSLMFGIAAPTRLGVVSENERAQARSVALQWFAYLRDGQPEMAAQLQLDPGHRKLPGDDVWAYYRDDPTGPDFMRKFVDARAVRNLLALGKQAQVRYYDTEIDQRSPNRATMAQVYSVTFERDGQPTTFLVRLVMRKQLRGISAGRGWWIVSTNLVTTPPESWPATARAP
jgi:hypothetical protein